MGRVRIVPQGIFRGVAMLNRANLAHPDFMGLVQRPRFQRTNVFDVWPENTMRYNMARMPRVASIAKVANIPTNWP